MMISERCDIEKYGKNVRIDETISFCTLYFIIDETK